MAEPTNLVTDAAGLVAKVIPWLPGVFGSALALKFLGDGITLWQRFTSFIAGVICTIYWSQPLIDLMGSESQPVDDAVKFAVGLFSLAVVREAFKEINKLELLQALKDRFLGAKNDVNQ